MLGGSFASLRMTCGELAGFEGSEPAYFKLGNGKFSQRLDIHERILLSYSPFEQPVNRSTRLRHYHPFRQRR
jgi:hypothetical protein